LVSSLCAVTLVLDSAEMILGKSRTLLLHLGLVNGFEHGAV
jgi:hypothetical protein